MAGSIKTFVYTASAAGVSACVFNMDESNGEAVSNVDLDSTGRGNSLPGIPRGLQPRYAVYRGASGVTRRVIISTEALFAALPATISVANPIAGGGALVLDLIRAVGERERLYTGADTGQTDGDLT